MTGETRVQISHIPWYYSTQPVHPDWTGDSLRKNCVSRVVRFHIWAYWYYYYHYHYYYYYYYYYYYFILSASCGSATEPPKPGVFEFESQCRLSRSIAQGKRARLITWRSWDRNPVERWSFLSSDVYRAAHSQVYWGWLPQFFSQKDYLPVRFRELDASNSILVAGSVEGAPLSWDIGAAW